MSCAANDVFEGRIAVRGEHPQNLDVVFIGIEFSDAHQYEIGFANSEFLPDFVADGLSFSVCGRIGGIVCFGGHLNADTGYFFDPPAYGEGAGPPVVLLVDRDEAVGAARQPPLGEVVQPVL